MKLHCPVPTYTPIWLCNPSGTARPILASFFMGAGPPSPIPPCPSGPSGYAITYGLGFFIRDSIAWSDGGMLDCVPGDVASSVVIATAAAMGSGWELIGSGGGGGSNGGREGQRRWQQQASGGNQAQHRQGGQAMVVHAASSTVNPIINLEVHEVRRGGGEAGLSGGGRQQQEVLYVWEGGESGGGGQSGEVEGAPTGMFVYSCHGACSPPSLCRAPTALTSPLPCSPLLPPCSPQQVARHFFPPPPTCPLPCTPPHRWLTTSSHKTRPASSSSRAGNES